MGCYNSIGPRGPDELFEAVEVKGTASLLADAEFIGGPQESACLMNGKLQIKHGLGKQRQVLVMFFRSGEFGHVRSNSGQEVLFDAVTGRMEHGGERQGTGSVRGPRDASGSLQCPGPVMAVRVHIDVAAKKARGDHGVIAAAVGPVISDTEELAAMRQRAGISDDEIVREARGAQSAEERLR